MKPIEFQTYLPKTREFKKALRHVRGMSKDVQDSQALYRVLVGVISASITIGYAMGARATETAAVAPNIAVKLLEDASLVL